MTSLPAAQHRVVPIRLPVAVTLGLTVLVAAVVHALLALRSPAPWIVPDELIYSELAKSVADGGLPAIREEVTFAYGIGYPMLLAPVWAIFDDVTTAYAVAKVVNALVLGLSAVPAYFLARRFVDEPRALLVAALSVAVPSMLYAGVLMTEVALYPAFLLAMLCITIATERPTLGTQAGVFGAIAVAASIKMLAAVLLVGYVASVVLYQWLDTRNGPAWRTRLREYRVTWMVLAVGVVALCGAAIVAGRSPVDVLGAYAVVLDNIDLLAVPWWFLLHVAELDLYVAVIPFAATMVVLWRGLRPGGTQGERLFAAAVLPASCAWFAVVSAFASTPSPAGSGYPENVARLHERGTFVLAALFLIGLVMSPARSVGPRRELVVAGLIAACLPALIPVEQFGENTYFQALALFPWTEQSDAVAWPLGGLAVTGALAMLYVARSRLGLCAAAVLLSFLVVSAAAMGQMHWASTWTNSKGLGSTSRWIDPVAADRTVSVLWAETEAGGLVEIAPRHRVVWLGEFFNRSVGPVYEIGRPMPYGLPGTPVRLIDGRVHLADGRPADLGGLVLVPCHVRVEGVRLARDPATGAAVVRVRGPVRASLLRPDECGPVP